jgi:hypothetical protein
MIARRITSGEQSKYGRDYSSVEAMRRPRRHQAGLV